MLFQCTGQDFTEEQSETKGECEALVDGVGIWRDKANTKFRLADVSCNCSRAELTWGLDQLYNSGY